MPRYHGTPEGRVQFTAAEETARDAQEKVAKEARPRRNAMTEINRLENTVTPRRLRDALASDEGKTWVSDVEALIAVESTKL